MKGQKLTSKITHKHFAIVRTSGAFPLDMLRYDLCHPVEEIDSRKIEQSLNPMIEAQAIAVLVARFTESAEPRWGYDRWASYRCEIEEVNSEYQYRRRDEQSTR